MPGLFFHTGGKQLVLWTYRKFPKDIGSFQGKKKYPKLKPQATTEHTEITFADFASPRCLLIPTFVGDHSPPIGNSDWL